MIFSIFGKKKEEGARRKGGSSHDGPDSEPAAGTMTQQREIARRTAEKIDEIEQQMDFTVPAGKAGRPGPNAARTSAPAGPQAGARPAAGSPANGPSPRAAEHGAERRAGPARPPAPPAGQAAAQPAQAPAQRQGAPAAGARPPSAQPRAPGAPVGAGARVAPAPQAGAVARPGANVAGAVFRPAGVPDPRAEAPVEAGSEPEGVSTMAFTTVNSDAIEVVQSELQPAFEEAAVLYANGQSTSAANVLWQAIKDNSLGNHAGQAWTMLFELYQATGKRAEYDSLAIDYASRFESSPPAWFDELAPVQEGGASAAVSASAVLFPAQVTAASLVKPLEQIQRAFQRSRPVDVDFSRVTAIEAGAAGSIQATIQEFRKKSRPMTLSGLEGLRTILTGSVEAGRRDDSDGYWLLLLEVLRLLREPQVFEDTAIDYCVTYEVSPPSWEELPECIKVGGAPATVMSTGDREAGDPDADSADRGSVIVLEGEIEGRTEELFKKMREVGKAHGEVNFECSRLRRINFVAAGDLLNEMVTMMSTGTTVRFRNVSHLVYCLMMVMGIHDMAEVQVRPR